MQKSTESTLKARPDGKLIILVFHSIFKDDNERNRELIDPSLGVTVDEFQAIIGFFIKKGIKFISVADLKGRLDTNNDYGMITFDDGYYNNTLILPILKKMGTPGLFFISTNFLLNQKCFWWDVLYRERLKDGIPINAIHQEMTQLKNSRKHEKIDEYIYAEFGLDSFNPICDSDRPFSPDELANFSKENLVYIGNHTCDHAALAKYSPQELHLQIQDAQNTLRGIIGYIPEAISYPYGKISLSRMVVKTTKDIGIKFVFTGYGQNHIPIKVYKEDLIWLTRNTINPNEDLICQYNKIRSDSLVQNCLKFFANRYGYWSFS